MKKKPKLFRRRKNKDQPADICIICEGSYPYYLGGVAAWVHQLIEEHAERTFHILTLMPPHPDLTFKYQFPKNVIGHTVLIVQDLPKGSFPFRTPKQTWDIVGSTLEGLITSKMFEDFDPLLDFFKKHRKILGKRILSDSTKAWDFFIDFYNRNIPSGPFKAYFGTVYTLTRSLFSMLLPELPPAKLYHSVCTGYAGFLLHRAKKELGVPCILTEHGIYTNERRIEIAMADWVADLTSLNLALEDKKATLKDFWLNYFFSLAHVCYMSADQVISTFEGFQELQLEGGTDTAKLRTIPHGVKLDKLKEIKKVRHPPTAAFIGRVVPIKDIKTFIHACHVVKQKLPDTRFLLLGPTDEDPNYVEECQKLIDSLGMSNDLQFTGSIEVEDYLSQIDVLVLTSISEAQPLVILELGAYGIPCVATNVGECKNLIEGTSKESSPLGPGGIVTPLVNPEATAKAIIRLLTDDDFYKKCSKAIEKRIKTYYRFDVQHDQYRELYQTLMQEPIGN